MSKNSDYQIAHKKTTQRRPLFSRGKRWMYFFSWVGIDLTTFAPQIIKSKQLHALSRTLLNRQREHSVRTLRSPLSAAFWRHCMLSGGTQRHALPGHQSEENGNINLSKYFFTSSGIEPTIASRAYSQTLYLDWRLAIIL